MNELSPINVIELSNGIQARFSDGARATLTLEGVSCTCLGRQGLPCSHIRAALPFYARRKWVIAEASRGSWGPRKYEAIGIDPRIFYPPPVDWRQNQGEPFVYLRIMKGFLFVFPDGAFFWLGKAHPEGWTKCSSCGTRACRHVEEALAEMQAVESAQAVAV
jgi:hypothetical protein